VKGEVVLRQALPGAAWEAETIFLESLDLSRRKDTIAWQLRTATSLARLYLSQERGADARDVLAPVYGSFSQGLDTADLRNARAVLDSIPARSGRARKGVPS
jgi:predicted ATPase